LKNENRVKWTEACFRAAVANASSLSDVLRAIGLKAKGKNFQTAKKYIQLWQLDTSHFDRKNKKALNKARANIKRMSNEEIFIENSFYSTSVIKRRILDKKLIEYKCAECGINSWKDKELSLHIDHINGINTDHRIENLRFLCPNCHSQTETYCGKNMRDIRKSKINLCTDCKCEIYYTSIRCSNCAKNHRPAQIEWPSKEKILKLIEENSMIGASRIIGCSDNSLRRHLKKLG